jgi:hypothetical protein
VPDLFDPKAQTHRDNLTISRSFRLRVGQIRYEDEKEKSEVFFAGAPVKALVRMNLFVLGWAFFVGSQPKFQ